MAKDFLKNGDTVVVTSRDETRVTETVSELSKEFGDKKVFGIAADIAVPEAVADASCSGGKGGKGHGWLYPCYPCRKGVAAIPSHGENWGRRV